MTFQTEFPDFPAADLPAIPAGFNDTSWHNNSAPSFENRAVGLSIWIDYADVSLREFEGGKRFIVHPIDAEGAFTSDDAILETDDWSEVQAFVAARGRDAFSDVLKTLADNDGAVLYWQVAERDAKAALACGAIKQVGELLVHPDAVEVTPGEAYTLTKEV
jgi:hypothetical protein